MVLRGIVISADEHAHAASVVAAVPGVASVDNQLRLMSGKKPPRH
jgi:osmotically-inducible protein OsmY